MARQQRGTIPPPKIASSKISTSQPNYVFPLLFCLVTVFIIYLPSLKNLFTNYDDDTYIGVIKSWNFVSIFSKIVAGNWAPLHLLLLTAEYQEFNVNPLGYHIVSLTIHLCNTAMIFWVMYKLTGKQMAATIAAVTWAFSPRMLNPLHGLLLKKICYTLSFIFLPCSFI